MKPQYDIQYCKVRGHVNDILGNNFKWYRRDYIIPEFYDQLRNQLKERLTGQLKNQ